MNRAISWFAENPVAANLLMALLMVGGLAGISSMSLKSFPDIDTKIITIGVTYLGAAPEEVEEGVCIRIEEEIEGTLGVKEIRSVATEGACTVMVELLDEADEGLALDEVMNRIDSIDTFPEETEKPVISKVTMKRTVMDIALTGTADERTLKLLGQRVRDEIALLPGITQVELTNARPYEISIEISETSLRRHGLTFQQVADAVRRSSLDLPGGSIKTAGGEILLRTKGQAYRGPEFERLVVLTRGDGTRVLLSDVAQVIDGFEDTDQSVRFDGDPSVMIRVFRIGDQSTLAIARALKAYVPEASARLPEGIELTIWRDGSTMLADRLSTLASSGQIGILLVLLLLGAFLRPQLSFWVSLGIPLSFLGALTLMGALGMSLSAVSLFGFILVLGILVDDAIVVGENVHTHQQQGDAHLQASIRGTREVFVPVTFGVLTTIVAFMPLYLSPGVMGQIFGVIASTVIFCLAFSLVECLLILPAHLGHAKKRSATGEVMLMAIPVGVLFLLSVTPLIRRTLAPEVGGVQLFGALVTLTGVGFYGLYRTGGLAPLAEAVLRLQARVATGLENFVRGPYATWLSRALEWRYTTFAIATALLFISLGVAASGRLPFSFFPVLEAETVSATLVMPQGVPAAVTREALSHIESTIPRLREEFDPLYAEAGGSIITHSLAAVGGHPMTDTGASSPMDAGRVAASGSHLGEVTIELIPSQERGVGTREVANRWRDLVGSIPDAVELSFQSSLFSAGDAIDVQLEGNNIDNLREAAARIRLSLAQYPGVMDITDSFRSGKRELKLRILPLGEALDLTLSDLARQVRQAFYGEEVQRIQRGRDDVRVMVRYPEAERRSLDGLERMRIRAPDGSEVPFGTIARADLGRGFSTIRRTDRRRVVNVTADVDTTRISANEVLAGLQGGDLQAILSDYPGIGYSLAGEQAEQAEAAASLRTLFMVALFLIYALLAIPLRSYIQPLIIMSVIPFALVGAIAGHLLMAQFGLLKGGVSFMSIMGFIAASGVVVNDSLVLIHYVNLRRGEGKGTAEAVRVAGVARFRPILLTSLTTFAGLSPLMLNRSVQAQFLVPMAISLAFGVLFATLVTLLVVPSGYLILEDLRRLFRRSGGGDEPLSLPTAAAGR